MPHYAVIRDGEFVERRFYPDPVAPGDIKHENGLPQLRPLVEDKPAHDPATEVLEGPVYEIADASVTEVWTKRSKTAEELSAEKDGAVAGLNGGSYNPLLKILLVVVNDNRAARAKINALIDATGQASTVAKFPTNQTTQIDANQLKAAIKALL